MKHFIQLTTLFCLLGLLATPRANAQQDINFGALEKAKGITVVYLSPAMIKNSNLKFTGNDSDIPGLADLMNGVNSIHIYSSDMAEQRQFLRRTFAPATRDGNPLFEKLFYLKEKESIIYLVGRIKGDRAKNLYLIVDEPDNFVAIDFNGNFTRKEIENAASNVATGPTKNTRNRPGRR